MSDSPQLDREFARVRTSWHRAGRREISRQARGTEYRQLLHGSRGGFESLTGHRLWE